MPFVLGNSVNHIEPLFQFRQEPRNFVRRILQVVVDRCDNFVFCSPNSAQQRIVLAHVAHQVDSTNPGALANKISNGLPALIRARVVHQDQFELLRTLWQHRFQFSYQRGQNHRTAIDGHHDGDSPRSCFRPHCFLESSSSFHLTSKWPKSSECG
jgi:hypothetical protein